MSRINHFSETKQFCLSNITLLNGDPLIICVTPSKVVIQKSRLGWWGRKLYEEKDMHRVAMTARNLPSGQECFLPAGMQDSLLCAFTNAALNCRSAEDFENELKEAAARAGLV